MEDSRTSLEDSPTIDLKYNTQIDIVIVSGVSILRRLSRDAVQYDTFIGCAPHKSPQYFDFISVEAGIFAATESSRPLNGL